MDFVIQPHRVFFLIIDVRYLSLSSPFPTGYMWFDCLTCSQACSPRPFSSAAGIGPAVDLTHLSAKPLLPFRVQMTVLSPSLFSASPSPELFLMHLKRNGGGGEKISD